MIRVRHSVFCDVVQGWTLYFLMLFGVGYHVLLLTSFDLWVSRCVGLGSKHLEGGAEHFQRGGLVYEGASTFWSVSIWTSISSWSSLFPPLSMRAADWQWGGSGRMKKVHAMLIMLPTTVDHKSIIDRLRTFGRGWKGWLHVVKVGQADRCIEVFSISEKASCRINKLLCDASIAFVW